MHDIPTTYIFKFSEQDTLHAVNYLRFEMTAGSDRFLSFFLIKNYRFRLFTKSFFTIITHLFKINFSHLMKIVWILKNEFL